MELQVFNSTEFGSVRTATVNGEVMFVGKDVADILGYQNGSRDINRHVDEEDRHKVMIFDGNQDKETIIINESGLYSLILSSKMPNAKKFKHWVTSEVLPAIRKHGLYAIDEISNIGYFVTDRRQPAGKVCVYIFIPPTSRHTYDLDTYSEEQLRDLSEIRRIASTWDSSKERKQALERLKSIGTRTTIQQPKSEMEMIINDQVTYTSVSQFRSPDSLPLFQQLTDTKRKLAETQNTLEKSRAYYAKANKEDKNVLRTEILEGEDDILRLTYQVSDLEKRIRNAENKILNP